MRKRLMRFALPLALLGLVAAACSSNSSNSGSSGSTGSTGATGSTGPSCPADFKVGLALDVGGLGDQSFNDAANRGLQKAITDGLVCKDNVKLVPANAAGSNLDDNIQALASAGYNYVEGVGFSFSPGVAKVAGQFPNVDFGVVDGYATFLKGGKGAPNVTDLNFKAQESSYLVGIAAAMQAKKDGSSTVGFLGGETGPLIQSFQAGYQAGVASVDPSIKVLIEYIGDTTQAFVNPTAGKALSLKMYSGGADVVYHAAGLSGAGLFQAAAEVKKYAIGVDSDQYLTASAAEQPYIITSALKRVDTATYDAIKSVGDGTFKNGVQIFDLANDGVGYATSDPALLTSDMVAAMEKARKAIIAGTIVVPDKPTS
jgi:basic membrane protein A and related proteins